MNLAHGLRRLLTPDGDAVLAFVPTHLSGCRPNSVKSDAEIVSLLSLPGRCSAQATFALANLGVLFLKASSGREVPAVNTNSPLAS